MRGRMQAGLTAFLGNFLPLIGPAVVCLVTLRKGMTEGLLVVLWASLPLLLLFPTAESLPVLGVATLLSLLVALIGSLVLKQTASWQHPLLVAVVLSAVFAVAFGALYPEQLSAIQTVLVESLEKFQQLNNSSSGQKSSTAFAFDPDTLNTTMLTGLLGYVVALTAILSLLLGRWWQAILYNPGGFRQEFHQLRFEQPLALGLMAVVVLANINGQQGYSSWGALAGLPLMLAGLALIHCAVAAKTIRSHWLVILYVCLVLVSPLSLCLMGLAVLDSFLNLRDNLGKPSGDA